MTSRLDTNSGKTLPHLATRLSESGGWISGCPSHRRQGEQGQTAQHLESAPLQGILTPTRQTGPLQPLAQGQLELEIKSGGSQLRPNSGGGAVQSASIRALKAPRKPSV